MIFGSVCSGVEAASLAWEPLGWRAAWFAEIDGFASRVLAARWPRVPNLGDMTALASRVRAGQVVAPDVLCGGTPCQAFSLAGNRGSLSDARGSLSLVFCDLANAIDERRVGDECVIVWENVPGVLNTQDNAFGCFLAGLAGHGEPLEPAEPRPRAGRSSDYWRWDVKLGAHVARWPNAGYVLGPQRDVAWRVLDAQYFGVAQRRRRVFVVASARRGFDSARVLLEFEGVRRDSPPSRKAREEVACASGRSVAINSVARTLTANSGPNAHGFGDFLSNQAINSGHLVVYDPLHITPPANGSNPEPGAPCHTLPAVSQGPLLVFGGNNTSGPIDVATACNAHGGAKGRLDFESETFVVQHGLRVRRLMPVECERLQGMPDGHTKINDNTKDGPRYKAIGNSWAVPVVRWLGVRLTLEFCNAW